MTMREALEHAMGRQPDSDAIQRLQERGVALLSQDTMSQAIHDVYCGIMADHEQARALIAAIQKQSA